MKDSVEQNNIPHPTVKPLYVMSRLKRRLERSPMSATELNASEEGDSLQDVVRCGRCKWRDERGYCWCPKLHESGKSQDESMDDHLVYSYNESGGFWVGVNFGCVHGEKAPNGKLCNSPGAARPPGEKGTDSK